MMLKKEMLKLEDSLLWITLQIQIFYLIINLYSYLTFSGLNKNILGSTS